MPTQADTKSVRTRRRIVDAAAHVLLTRGYAGLRLSDVAEIADVQAPSIYYYFDSRDLLIEEAIAVGLERARTLVLAALDTATDVSATERLDVAVAAHLGTLLTHSDHAAAAIRTVPQLPDEPRQRFRTAQREYLDLWRDLLIRARTEGGIDPGLDPGTALMVIIGALNWTAEWWDPAQGSLDGVIAAAQRLVRQGLTA